jgi:hypothetical protein
MAGDENIYDALRIMGFSGQVNERQGFVYRVNDNLDGLEEIPKDIWEISFQYFDEANEDPRTRKVPMKLYVVANRGGHGPWETQQLGTLKEQKLTDAQSGYSNLGLNYRIIR